MKLTIRKPLLFITVLLWPLLCGAQEITFKGTVVDENGTPLYPASIGEIYSGKGAVSNNQGEFEFNLTPQDTFFIKVSFLGFQNFFDTILYSNQTVVKQNYQLKPVNETIEDVYVVGNKVRESTFNPINIKSFDQVPTVSGNIESMLKTLPGVASSNELSSQYSVRGGSFEENLIYVNDIEIYRPILVQSAKQEGLSFINPAMVSSINFSAGGFGVEYGDKLSSVLDIKYRRPNSFNGSLSASLLGSSFHIEGASKNQKFTHNSGLRYKSTQYVLGSLDTKGEYVPTFIDFQTFLTYDISKKVELSLLGNISINEYALVPTTRSTDFGSIQQSFNFEVDYDGREIDKFDSYLGALTVDIRPNDNLLLKFIGSGYYSHEQITYDIASSYSIYLATSGSKNPNRDSLINIGVGFNLDHARNYLDAKVLSAEHKGIWSSNNITLKWGGKWKSEFITDQKNEWLMSDSAGYSLPYSGNNLLVSNFVNYDTSLLRTTISAFTQGAYSFFANNNKITITAGLRGFYNNTENEFKLSPRGNIVIHPNGAPRLAFHIAGGLYYQPPFYKELHDHLGNFYPVKSQKSIHSVLGVDFYFNSWGRPFTFTTEAYYKHLSNIIPFKTDDVQIIYLPNFTAKAYAMGIDFKVYGEFVPGLESWFSLSVLQTKEDVYNDSYVNLDGKVVKPGFYRRASDQLLNLSIFFQDYLPMNPKYRVHLTLNLTTGLPYSGPDFARPSEIYTLGPYRRVDMGFSRMLREKKKGKFGFNDAWISFEILNLFGVQNKVSYDWVRTVENNAGVPNTFAVPNYLTGRRFNVKLSTKL